MTFANLQEKARQGRTEALAKLDTQRARRKSLAMFFSNRQAQVAEQTEQPVPAIASMDTDLAA